MNRDQVSVIIPVFNGAAFLAQTIESVFAQTFKSLEVIVVDDGSTDASREIALRFGSRVTYHHQANRGTGAARNEGIRRANGSYLAFLDQDDLWTPDKLDCQMDYLRCNPADDAVFGLVRQFTEASPGAGESPALLPGFIPSALLIRTDSFSRVGLFSTTWLIGEWADWYTRARDLGLRMGVPPQLVVWRRLHEGMKGARYSGSRGEYARILKQSLDRRRKFRSAASAGPTTTTSHPTATSSGSAEDSAADRVSFFEAIETGFARAVRKTAGTLDRSFRIAGRHVRLRFADASLMGQMVPAVAHLEVQDDAPPDLTVGLWGGRQGEPGLPLLVEDFVQLLRMRRWERLESRHVIKGYNDGRISATFHFGPDILCVLDLQRNLGFFWIADAEAVPYYERCAPLTGLLQRWMVQHGRYLIHAAGVGTANGGLLISGKSGSGKSTTTLLCLEAGLGVIGDDSCLLEIENRPFAHSLYGHARLVSAEDLARFPLCANWVVNIERKPQDKLIIALNQSAPDKLVTGFPVKAVLVPRITGRPETTLTATSAGRALMAVAPSTLFQYAGPDPRVMHQIAHLVKNVPCYELELGTDFLQIPTLIRNLLESL